MARVSPCLEHRADRRGVVCSPASGDTHQLAYAPQTVLIVENRDCRLWFPDAPGTIVVEGGGKAASSLLADVAWTRAAARVYYWGDMDADGYAILDHLWAAFATSGIRFESILMDSTALTRFANLGVNRDRHGAAFKPSSTRLQNLTAAENDAYAAVSTTGSAAFRRIEQERIPITEALHELAIVGWLLSQTWLRSQGVRPPAERLTTRHTPLNERWINVNAPDPVGMLLKSRRSRGESEPQALDA
ncbi:Wadjet anti-phage system protein JetD domain-containing protein [Agromyces sp. MMS24-K17]|uniref:Wadjet anti-phage system protein JetD domain-containing protein n=1 Tax=Agromyces sp. MMS24-K17 TaxID=3372850 RepID=UPI003754EAC6